MAFALSAFEAIPMLLNGAQPRRAIQRVILHVTGTAADVDLDIGDDSGTFWSAADNTDIGANSLVSLQNIIAQASKVCGLYSPEIDAYGVRVGTEVQTLDLTSAATTGTTGATRTLTVTGLLTTDNILNFDIVEDGATPVSVVEAAPTCAVNDQYVVTFSADPGAGLEGRVSFTRAAAATPVAGQYSLAYQNSRPNYTFPAGAGLTAYTIVIDYLLLPNTLPVVVNYGVGG